MRGATQSLRLNQTKSKFGAARAAPKASQRRSALGLLTVGSKPAAMSIGYKSPQYSIERSFDPFQGVRLPSTARLAVVLRIIWRKSLNYKWRKQRLSAAGWTFTAKRLGRRFSLRMTRLPRIGLYQVGRRDGNSSFLGAAWYR